MDWGDFNDDGVPDLVCMDGAEKCFGISYLFRKMNNVGKVFFTFRYLREDLHYRGKKGGVNEPRDGLIADLNGDGLDDLGIVGSRPISLLLSEKRKGQMKVLILGDIVGQTGT